MYICDVYIMVTGGIFLLDMLVSVLVSIYMGSLCACVFIVPGVGMSRRPRIDLASWSDAAWVVFVLPLTLCVCRLISGFPYTIEMNE